MSDQAHDLDNDTVIEIGGSCLFYKTTFNIFKTSDESKIKLYEL